jgi:hypothetical protein
MTGAADACTSIASAHTIREIVVHERRDVRPPLAPAALRRVATMRIRP